MPYRKTFLLWKHLHDSHLLFEALKSTIYFVSKFTPLEVHWKFPAMRKQIRFVQYSGHWFHSSGHWFQSSGHWFQSSGHWFRCLGVFYHCGFRKQRSLQVVWVANHSATLPTQFYMDCGSLPQPWRIKGMLQPTSQSILCSLMRSEQMVTGLINTRPEYRIASLSWWKYDNRIKRKPAVIVEPWLWTLRQRSTSASLNGVFTHCEIIPCHVNFICSGIIPQSNVSVGW